MSAYIGLQQCSKAAISADGWYLNLGDIGFWFPGEDNPDAKDLCAIFTILNANEFAVITKRFLYLYR